MVAGVVQANLRSYAASGASRRRTRLRQARPRRLQAFITTPRSTAPHTTTTTIHIRWTPQTRFTIPMATITNSAPLITTSITICHLLPTRRLIPLSHRRYTTSLNLTTSTVAVHSTTTPTTAEARPMAPPRRRSTTVALVMTRKRTAMAQTIGHPQATPRTASLRTAPSSPHSQATSRLLTTILSISNSTSCHR